MKSIRRRLIVTLLAGFVLLLGAGEAAVYLITRASLERESDSALLSRAQSMASMVSVDEGKVQADFPDDIAAEFSSNNSPQYFGIRDMDGKLLKSSRHTDAADLQNVPGLRKAPAFWNSVSQGHPARSVGFTFTPEQDENDEDGKKIHNPPPPVLSFVLTADQTALAHTLERLLAVLLGVGILAAAGTALLVATLVPAGLRPLDEIGRQAMRIDANTLGSRFPLESVPLELRSVCERLNDLLSRLDDSFRRERRFSSDVAHELRTPVAELRALAEVALKWPTGEADAQNAFQDALDIALKMDGIVAGLLALIRCEEGRRTPGNEALAVWPLIEKAWIPFASRAEGKRLNVTLGVPDQSVIRGDSAALEIILTNLFSNAVEYTPDGGDLEITARANNGHVLIRCENTADNLELADLPHLCERFWRKDSARHDSTHSGLGLAIAQQFARHLGAGLEMELTTTDRFQVSLSLPAVVSNPGHVLQSAERN